MTFLVQDDNGKFRNHGEAVYDGDKMIFMAPPENMVVPLMEQLFDWMKKSKDTVNLLILSCIFHYEFVFIHPFSDGNGRMARLWQTAILSEWEEFFKYMPIESLIRKKILNLIKENPAITQVQMAKAINITRDGVAYNIRFLKENGIIERIGSTKKENWKVLK